ncbi:pilus (MSHA type) biogenesis protein MshL [Herbaspirillum sp. SJZ107]|uniref:pilus (MSHA type) biogenesis protein MshL n=1 Tax=Herbaspirillum sp. SJZ107 TaxID=2572881 RepID=UPI00114F6A24|nr:pilus (MSHA type) biogenesis protein MshL [Herbaspirillum sp. SJZ107]TQK11185.1 MSHA biogenesis protein MshL [Herbaspirillum sp. SJZ107]
MHTTLNCVITRATSIASAAALLLAGCQSAPNNTTYDQIRKEVAGVNASRPAAAPSVDSAVADALLPPAAALATQLPKARPALEERFNVSFNNVPAQQFFRSIVAGTRYNILVHPDVSGSITANLKDVTLPETLDAIREMYGYDYKIDGTRISIKPLTMQTKMFHVNYLVGKRRGASNLRVTSTSVSNAVNNQNGNQNGGQGATGQNNGNQSNQYGGNPGQVESTDVNTTSDNDFWADLKAAVEAIVGPKEGGRNVVISPQSGVIVIRAMPDELRNVDAYLKATQLAVDRQVILEAKILEVELNDSYQSGVNWASFASIRSSHDNRVSGGIIGPGASLTPLPFGGGQPAVITDPATGLSASTGFSLSNAVNAAGSMFGLAVQTSNFAALLSFLETQGTVHVLSSPRVAAINNQKAVLKIGTDEFYVTGVTTTTALSTSSNTVTPSVTLQPFFSGVVLDVTPQIDEKGNILLHVHPSVSQVSTVNKDVSLGSAGNLTLPLAASATSELDSIVRGTNGQVVAIGGLMRQASTNDSSSVPGATNVPVLSTLFGQKKRVNQKRELVVLIKPTIVEGINNWNDDLLDANRRIEQLDPRARGIR